MKGKPRLRSNLKVFVGIPWLSNDDEYRGYLKSCLTHIEAQETSVEVLKPEITPTFHGDFHKGQQDLLYAIMDRMNAVIRKFIPTDATHLFIVDADVELPPNALDVLLRHDVDIASGVYPFHNFEVCRAMMFGRMRMKGNPCGFFVPRDWDYMKDTVMGGDYPVSGGTGCMLIKRRVLMKHHPRVKPLRFSKKGGECGADVYFWKRVQDMGFTARVDANIVCGHLPEYPLSERNEWLGE